MSLKFVHPSTHLVAGPTGSGKTNYVIKIILDGLFDPMPLRIVWVYSAWQPSYQQLKQKINNIQFVSTLEPELYESFDPNQENLLIVDDKMSSKNEANQILRYFTEGSHHRNLTIIYIVQNVFDKGKDHRGVSLNSQYITLFRNPRDKQQIDTLARQMYPTSRKFLVDAFHDATKDPYGYLLLDLRAETPEDFRVRTKIFTNEVVDVYIKK